MRIKKGLMLSLMLIAGITSHTAIAEEASFTMALGGFDVNHSGSAMLQAEYRFAHNWSGIQPHAGVFVTADSAAYLYGGVGYPLALSESWLFTPSVSLGYFHQGADKDLGHDVEIYSQLKLEYKLSADSWVGVGYTHISNGDLDEANPGAETAYISYRIDI